MAEALAKALQPQFERLADKMLERVDTRLKAMSIELEKKDACIKSLQQTVAQMQMKIDEHEQYSRREALRISGLVPPQSDDDEEQSTEGTSANENTDNLVLAFCNEVLALSPPLDMSDIARSHRSGDPSAGNARPVLVKFSTYRIRDRVIRARKKLKTYNKDNPHPVYINEDLTKLRADLAYRARQFKKEKLISDTWTWDGIIRIKDNTNHVHVINTVL